MVTHPDIVTKPNGVGASPGRYGCTTMPVRVGDVGAIGEHATIAQHYLVAGADARSRAHKACIAERNAPFSDPAAPYADLHTLTDGIDRGKEWPIDMLGPEMSTYQGDMMVACTPRCAQRGLINQSIQAARKET